MLDHVGLAVADFDRSKAFFTEVLATLSIVPIKEITAEQTGAGAHIGFGTDDRAFFWIGTGRPPAGATHVAFVAESRAEVDAFHAAALQAGGTDNGAPGLRPHYHADYYGAFIYDPDGNNIEAVCRKPA